jgi:hypothetical protein
VKILPVPGKIGNRAETGIPALDQAGLFPSSPIAPWMNRRNTLLISDRPHSPRTTDLSRPPRIEAGTEVRATCQS